MAVPAALPTLQAQPGSRCNTWQHGTRSVLSTQPCRCVFGFLLFLVCFFPAQIRGGAFRDAQEIDPGQGAQTRGEGACGRSARLRGQREAAAIVRQSVECRARHGPARCGPSWRYVNFSLIALANASVFARVVLSLSALARSSELK